MILDHGRSVRMGVEEEVKQGIAPATTLFQHSVELTVLKAIRNLKIVTLNPVQVRLIFAYVRVHSSTKSA